ncbi:MAG: hypothetical protein HQM09_21645 [Candidatus Riflebacteria bacterium]|nr:hypothetical protein [Candidatus Riflebacteria bacterium]
MNQMTLVKDILGALCKQGVKGVGARQHLNSIIAATNSIIAEIERPNATATPARD